MKANPSARVEVEGHCDDIGAAEYNLALGAKRAEATKDFLVSQGISADRLVTINYGKEAPAFVIYWSWDSHNSSVRWDRIGQRIQ